MKFSIESSNFFLNVLCTCEDCFFSKTFTLTYFSRETTGFRPTPTFESTHFISQQSKRFQKDKFSISSLSLAAYFSFIETYEIFGSPNFFSLFSFSLVRGTTKVLGKVHFFI